MQFGEILFHSVICSSDLCSEVWNCAVSFSAVQSSAVLYSAVKCSAVHHNSVQCSSIQFNAVQCIEVLCRGLDLSQASSCTRVVRRNCEFLVSGKEWPRFLGHSFKITLTDRVNKQRRGKFFKHGTDTTI